MTGSDQEVQAIRHRFPNKVPVSLSCVTNNLKNKLALKTFAG